MHHQQDIDGTERETVSDWACDDVVDWLQMKGFSKSLQQAFLFHQIDGTILLDLTEEDMRREPLKMTVLGDIKRLHRHILELKQMKGVIYTTIEKRKEHENEQLQQEEDESSFNPLVLALRSFDMQYSAKETWSGMIVKLFVSLCFILISVFATALTMVFVHSRVPDPSIYPPLPDIVLDNLPLIPWAFAASELIVFSLLVILIMVLFMHKYRGIILRRVFAITSTVFLMRCLTMVVTSLSVPGLHLGQGCLQHREQLPVDQMLVRAWKITSRFGLSITGLTTCGDYMFSGHSSCLTLFNLFICEYTPKKWRGLHTLTWIMNIFGMFFVLASHEHYTLDVCVAFYISSRLFRYYHHHANIQHVIDEIDKDHKDQWFIYLPLYKFLEQNSNGKVPNEYELPWHGIVGFFTARRRARVTKQR
jgi:hypothetical protein